MGEFRVLGPVEVWAGGRRVDAGQPRQRAVLAGLLADAGQMVPVDTLVYRVWGDAPPRGVRQSLHAHITRIRQVLAQATEPGTPPARLLFTSGCYLLDVDQDRVDLHRFRRLVERGRQPDRPDDERAALLRQAIGLWSGEALAGLGGTWAAQARQTWRQQYLETTVGWAQAELRLDNPEPVIGPLTDLAGEFPLTESVAAALMRALSAAGRPAEALARYETIRRRLAGELGTDPSVELQTVYQSILRGEQPSTAPARPDGNAALVVPAQLPPDVATFAGRDRDLAQLDALLARAHGGAAGGTPTAVVISAVSGTAGVGKTTLAVRWAHRVAGQFPDGQLYVNLRGFDPSGRVMTTGEAVRGFLDALGVPAARIPSGLDAQVGLYRSVIAGKRILVLLDNARDVEQVRPLLPGTPTAVAVVTSRNQLTGLVVADGAHPVNLDVLTDAEARNLLVRRLGADRVDAEEAAVEEIVTACARLPLALAITAARAQQTRFPLAALAAELGEAGRRLDALDTGEPAGQVRSVFSWSYAALNPPAGRLFRLLGLHPGPDISVPAAASLAGRPVAETRRMLGELAQANLLLEHAPGRYLCHDLLRVYAADLTAGHDPQEVRRAATLRLLDHYAHTAYAAERLVNPSRGAIEVPPGPPAADVRPEQLVDDSAAMAWLHREYPVLLAALRRAVETGHDTHAWRLAWVLDSFLGWRGYWHELHWAWRSALDAGQRLADVAVQASAHRGIARAHTRLGRYAEAAEHLEHALDLYGRLGNRLGQAHVHQIFAHLCERQGARRRALEHAERELTLFQAVGDDRQLANALNDVGWAHARLGDHRRALDYCQRALTLHQEGGTRAGQAATWDSLGYAHHHLGHHREAIECYRHALELCRELGDLYNQADALNHLGEAQRDAGDADAARGSWTEAIGILTDLDHAAAKQLRAKLDELP